MLWGKLRQKNKLKDPRVPWIKGYYAFSWPTWKVNSVQLKSVLSSLEKKAKQSPNFEFSKLLFLFFQNYWVRSLDNQWKTLVVKLKYLATKRTETVWIKKASLTDFTSVCDSFSWPWLRPFIQKHHSGAVDNVGLDASDVQHLLNLRYPYHIMVWRPPNLFTINTRND